MRLQYLATIPRSPADEEHRHAQFLAEPRDEVEHLRLDGDVELWWLVGDEQLWPAREPHGDHHAALSQTA